MKDLLVKFLTWRLKYISTKNFVLMLSGLVGLVAGIAAVVLKSSVHELYLLLARVDIKGFDYLYLLYPFVGILISALLMKYVFKEKSGHGITNILFNISKRSSIIKRAKMYSAMVTSAITVAFGGSVGLESPIVVTGSAIGSNIGRVMHLSFKKRTLLIGCGAAGGISAIFDSPIAGVVFSIEVILADITIAAFIPLLIASACGALVSLVLLGDEILFSFKLTDPFVATDVPFYIVLGIVCGLVSVYFVRVNYLLEDGLKKIGTDMGKAVWGGLVLCLIILIFPPIYGEGYGFIKMLLSGKAYGILENNLIFGDMDSYGFLLLFILGIMLVKPLASVLTIGAGGSGGMFGPSLFLGGMTGYFVAETMSLLPIEYHLSAQNFTLVGMCGIMSGILGAPLTAIFLIAEVTSGYTLFVPLMLVSAISYSTFSYFEKYSLYNKQLIEKGDFIPHDKDRQVLSLIDLFKIIETDLLTIHPEAKLEDLVKLVRASKRNIFPVVDENRKLVGVVTLDEIREIMFDAAARKTMVVKSLMNDPPAEVSTTENMQSVMNKFEKTGAWNLPVIDQDKYVGFISKSRIFNAYRKKLIRQQQE